MRASLRITSLVLLLASSSCAPGPMTPTTLPPPGTPVFGPQGLVGVVGGQTGGTAIVNPTGGGAPGMLVPNGNGTATIFQPNRPPIVVPNPPR